MSQGVKLVIGQLSLSLSHCSCSCVSRTSLTVFLTVTLSWQLPTANISYPSEAIIYMLTIVGLYLLILSIAERRIVMKPQISSSLNQT